MADLNRAIEQMENNLGFNHRRINSTGASPTNTHAPVTNTSSNSFEASKEVVSNKNKLERNMVNIQRKYQDAVDQLAIVEKNFTNTLNNVQRRKVEDAKREVERLGEELEMAERRFKNKPNSTRKAKAPPGFLSIDPIAPKPQSIKVINPFTPGFVDTKKSLTAAGDIAAPVPGAYPTEATLKKHFKMNSVPIMFNIKNGQFKVSIPRAAGTKGSLEICSPSLKGIRDSVIADAGNPFPPPVSTYGKVFGRPRGGKRTRRHESRRGIGRSTRGGRMPTPKTPLKNF